MKESKFLNYKCETVLHKVENGELTAIQGREALARLKNKRGELEAKREKALIAILKDHANPAFS